MINIYIILGFLITVGVFLIGYYLGRKLMNHIKSEIQKEDHPGSTPGVGNAK